MNHRAHRATTENRETTERTEQFPLYSLWCVICGVLVGCLSWPATGEAVQVKQVLDHGDPANRIDLVFLAYGYRDDEVEHFAQEVPWLLKTFFADPLFQEYQKYFNAYQVTGIPKQPVADQWRQDDPALACGIGGAKDFRAICATVLKLREALADRGVVPDAVVVYEHYREEQYMFGHNGIALLGGGGFQPGEHPGLLHEFGHAFAELADEVVPVLGPLPKLEAWQIESLERRPNLTAKTRREEIKWKHWIVPTTPLPTPFKTLGIPGLYPGLYQGEGGVYYLDLYRPLYASKMGAPLDIPSTSDLPYGPINDEALLKRLYTLVSPIDRVEPNEARVLLTRAETKTFSVVPPQPLTHALEVSWTLDGTLVHRGEAFVFTAASVAPGRHSLQAEVRDHDPRVRHDPDGLLTETRTWQIAVDSAFLIAPIPNQTVKEGQRLEVQVVRLQPDVPLDVEGLLPRGASFNPTSGLLTWTPDFDQARHDQPGRVSLKVLARDAQGTDIKPFTITVENVNRVPILQFVERVLRRQVTVGESSSLHLPVVDLDGEAFDYFFRTCRLDPTHWMKEPPSCLPLVPGPPPGVQFDPTTQTLTITPAAAHVGLYRADLQIRERGHYHDYVLIYINVLPAPTPPAGWLTPMRQGNMLLLSWEGQGVLQAADSVLGPWLDLPDAKSPYAVSVTEAAMKFYRLAPPTSVEPAAPVTRKSHVTVPERPPSLTTPTVIPPPAASATGSAAQDAGPSTPAVGGGITPPTLRPTIPSSQPPRPVAQRTDVTTEHTEKRTASPYVRVTPPPAAPAVGSAAQRAGPSRPAAGGGVIRSRRSLSRR